MAKMSVPEAAERLGVSPARVRQRIEDGSLVAEKVGGRWLVDLEVSPSRPAQAGRPVSQFSVWWSLLASEIAKAAEPSSGELSRALESSHGARQVLHAASAEVSAIQKALAPALESAAFKKAALAAADSAAAQQKALQPDHKAAVRPPALLARMRIAEAVLVDLEHQARQRPSEEPPVVADFLGGAQRLSRSSRSRAIHRLADAVESRDHERLLAWLSNRASRRTFVAAPSDLNALRGDSRLLASGVSDPRSGMEDLRVLEGYVKQADLAELVSDHWLERPGIDDRPNVILHVSPVVPPAIGPMLLAADLAEHSGPRELVRAHELLDEAIEALMAADQPGTSA